VLIALGILFAIACVYGVACAAVSVLFLDCIGLGLWLWAEFSD
jgi:hypothetical protein